MIQDIIANLQSLGGGLADYSGGLSGLTQISGQDFADALTEMYQIGYDNGQPPEAGEELLTAGMFPGITKSQIEALSGRTYSPLLQTSGQSFLNELTNAYNKGASRAAGGFAGSGQLTSFQQNIKDVYGRQMTDVLADIGASKAQAVKSIQDTIDSYRETALAMRYNI
tara:strand:- start:1411 stop:1914 length:504 start_codon:yes stop_codon:yes gene_type:complete